MKHPPEQQVPQRGVADPWRRAADFGRECPDADAVASLQLALGADPSSAAFDCVFEMVESIVRVTDRVHPELIGFEFVAGVPSPAQAERVEHSVRLRALLDEMLERWPVVVHVFQGWSLSRPREQATPSTRLAVVVITVHLRDSTRMATCRIDREAGGARTSKVIKGILRSSKKTPTGPAGRPA